MSKCRSIAECNFHDSLIEQINILNDGKTIVINVDYAFWMQKDYTEGTPETGILKITFDNVYYFSIPPHVTWNEISILDLRQENDTFIFSLMNDMTDAYLEISVSADIVTVEEV